MQVLRQLSVIVATVIAYYLLYHFNDFAFSLTEYSYGVAWIFLPSGLLMAFALIFSGWGALGITLASLIVGIEADPDGDMVTLVGAGLISGISAMSALWICQNKFKLDVAMTNLSASTLLKMSAIFSLVSPVLHQTWYFLRGHTENLVASTSVMAIGDFTGTIIMLYVARLLLMRLPLSAASK